MTWKNVPELSLSNSAIRRYTPSRSSILRAKSYPLILFCIAPSPFFQSMFARYRFNLIKSILRCVYVHQGRFATTLQKYRVPNLPVQIIVVLDERRSLGNVVGIENREHWFKGGLNDWYHVRHRLRPLIHLLQFVLSNLHSLRFLLFGFMAFH
jgi:hypothetical protein